jgi:TonB-linked SusC/RagA family outer membrane protein
MKLLIAFFFAGLLGASASTYSQQTKFNLKLDDASVKEVFKLIEEKSEFVFFYNEDFVDVNRKVNIDVTDQKVESILDELFKGTKNSYKIYDRQIVILTKSSNDEPSVANLKSIAPQKREISGTVKDSNGLPLPATSVSVKGTTIGILSDADGNFKLSVPTDAVALIFSFVGMKTQEILIAGKTSFKVTMEDQTIGIEEVVAVGYGMVKKGDLTGSVSQVKIENATERSVSSVQQLLQGQVSGVQITSNSGATGSGISFYIRGANTISGSNQPLIVIDGYPVENDNGLATATAGSGGVGDYVNGFGPDNILGGLNPGEIESVEILKDASATAIYGSRAANGVVLITTKHGKDGENRIEYSFRTDVSKLPKQINLLSTVDYMNFVNEAYIADGQNVAYAPADFNTYGNINTNWQDLIYRTGSSQNHQLSITGGDKKMKYAVVMGYLGQEGIVKNNRYDRGTIRINLDREVSKKFKFGVSMSGSMSNNKAVAQSSGRNDVNTSVVYGALRFRPLLSPYNTEDQIDVSQQGNPLTLIELSDDQNKLTTILANLYLVYSIMPGLDLKANGGVNTTSSRRDFYQPRGTYLGNIQGGFAYLGQNGGFNYLNEYTLSYNKTVKIDHRINAVVGYTWQQWKNQTFGLYAMNFPNDYLRYYNLFSAAAISNPQTTTSESGLASFIGRFNYSYKSKYLFTFTNRYDGSTRLAEGHKWAYFPSAALGWNMHKENFMKQYSWISEFKWRVSYGYSGNQTIGIGATKSRLATTTAVVGQTMVTSFSVQNMQNSTLHWETTRQANGGFDVSLLSSRITFGFDYYKKISDDLLMNQVVPPSTGFSSYSTNLGSIENQGYEFDLRGKILTKELNWDVIGNISFNRNKVLNLGGLTSMNGPSFAAIGSQVTNVNIIGKPVASFYGYRITGIYQNQDEIDAGPVDASSNPTPGSFKYKDISGIEGTPDGKIDALDREIIGNPYPKFIFGLTNNLRYKNLSLSVFIQGNIGQDVINATRWNLDGLAFNSSNITRESYENRWTGEGTSYKYPKVTRAANPFNTRFSDFVVEDASFIRLKSLVLSYTFDKTQVKLAKSIKVFVSAENLLTITNYSGYDPEINSRGADSMLVGIDNGSIPQYRTFSAGVNLNF